MKNNSVKKCCICDNENIGEFIIIDDKKYHLNCITNLQEELKGYKQERENLFKTIHDLQKEIKGLKEVNNYSKRELYKINKDRLEANLKLVEENERLKNNQRYYKNGVFSLEYDKETMSDMIDDYKSRCEKLREYINTHKVSDTISFPLMKKDQENQVKSCFDYEFNQIYKKDLENILNGGENNV